jgi:hypothetical protein
MVSRKHFFLLGLAFLFSSCCFVIDKGGGGISWSIKESQDRKVFVSEYVPPKNPLRINDSIVINIKEAWLEHAWTLGGRCNEKTLVNKEDKYQLIVVSDAKSMKGHLSNWMIGNTFETSFFGTYDNSMTVRANGIPKEDTLRWQVHPAHQQDTSSMGPVIGEFILIRR